MKDTSQKICAWLVASMIAFGFGLLMLWVYVPLGIMIVFTCWLWPLLLYALLILFLNQAPEVKKLQNMNQHFQSACPQDNILFSCPTYTCDTKHEYDVFVNSAMVMMESYLDGQPEWCAALPQNMRVMYVNYDSYIKAAQTLKKNLSGIKLWYFEQQILPEPQNKVCTIKVRYDTPAGRNHYSCNYSMTYQQFESYIKRKPIAPNTYNPATFLKGIPPFADCAGTYVLHNKSDDMHYVGQAHSLHGRIKQHFTGKGNGDVYFDYRIGKAFVIYIYPLTDSGFANLNDQERYYIAKYDAYNRGYNKTRGNMA